MSDPKCVFCRIISGALPSTKVAEWADAIAIVPLAPVTEARFPPGEGHVLVIPKAHVSDYATDPIVTAATFGHAAELARGRDSNLITSKGAAATQTVFHLHVHLVPRVVGDALPLPWTPQQSRESVVAPVPSVPGDLPAEYLVVGGARIDDCLVQALRNPNVRLITSSGFRLDALGLHHPDGTIESIEAVAK